MPATDMNPTPLDVRQLFAVMLRDAMPAMAAGTQSVVRAKVVGSRAGAGAVDAMHSRHSVDLQVLGRDGVHDPESPVLSDVPLTPLWVGTGRVVVCVPPVGSTVRVAWEYGDPTRPVVLGMAADGYQVPAGAVGVLTVVVGSVSLELSESACTITAPSVVLGDATAGSLVKTLDLLTWLNTHTHPVTAAPVLEPGPIPIPTGMPVKPCDATIGTTKVKGA